MPRVSPTTIAAALTVRFRARAPQACGTKTSSAGQWIGLPFLAVALAGSPHAYAQTECEGGTCVYDFSVSQEGYFPDWTEVSPLDINWLDVRNGVGHINVLSNGPQFFADNNAHVIWNTIGWSYPAADATIRFTGDNGHTGWIEKWADGRSACRGLEHARRASDEILVLTIYDDGLSYIGGFIGGDLLPLGETLPPLDKKGGFAVMGVVQLTRGDSQPRVLDYVQTGPIEMRGTNLHLHVSAQVDSGVWTVETQAHQEGGGETYRASARVTPPNTRGTIGLNAITGAKPFCIYKEGGEFNRQFEVSRVVASVE